MTRPVLAVVGHGMVGQWFIEQAVAHQLHVTHRIVVFGEEGRVAYDRVHLSSLFDGVSDSELALTNQQWLDDHDIELRTSAMVTELDVDQQCLTVTSAGVNETVVYDQCVLATGSSPFVPPMPGVDATGVFVYRTIDDLRRIEEWSAGSRRGIVIGGGLLGLEAANALRLLGLETTVVEMAPRLMPVQLDIGGAGQLRREIESLGITVHCGIAPSHLVTTFDDTTGAATVTGIAFVDETIIDTDVVVISAGIRPRDELARHHRWGTGRHRNRRLVCHQRHQRLGHRRVCLAQWSHLRPRGAGLSHGRGRLGAYRRARARLHRCRHRHQAQTGWRGSGFRR
jgi:nitrite reductase (NADH) large subunit